MSPVSGSPVRPTTWPGTAGSVGRVGVAGTAVAAGLAFVAWRTAVGRLRRLARRRGLLVVLAVLAATGVALSLNFGPEAAAVALPDAVVPSAAAGLAVFLAIVVVLGVRRCPIRLRPADITWLVPLSGSARVLALAQVGRPLVRLVPAGVLALVVPLLAPNAPRAAGPVLAVGLLALLVRTLSTAAHLVARRWSPVAVAFLAASVWVVAAADLALAVLRPAGSVPLVLTAVASGPRTLLVDLVTAVVVPGTVVSWWPAALLVAGLMVVTILLASGYEEDAAHETWQREALAGALRDGSLTGEATADLVAKRVRSGVPSWQGGDRLVGAGALAWRDLAQLRRLWPSELRPLAVALVVASLVAAYAPAWSGALVAVFGLLLLVETQGRLAQGAGRGDVLLLPAAGWRRAAALQAVPIGLAATGLLLVAVPWLLVAAPAVGPLVVVPTGLAVTVAAVAVGGLVGASRSTLPARIFGGAAASVGVAAIGAAATWVGIVVSAVPSWLVVPAVVGAAAVLTVLAWRANGHLLTASRS